MQNVMTPNGLQSIPTPGANGRPTIPSGRQPVVERKVADPSSAQPRGKAYPIPAFTDNRVRFAGF